MRLRLTPRDTAFFDLFEATAENLVDGAGLLAEVVTAPPPDRPALVKAVRECEHRGDELTHATLRRLNSTFVTPFDRQDIYSLTSSLDDCLDHMDEAADLVVRYRLDGLPPGVVHQADLLGRMALCTREALPRLRTMEKLDGYWVEINRLENEADDVYRAQLADLFETAVDPIALLKVKEVIEALEEAADAFETVSHHVETLVVKES